MWRDSIQCHVKAEGMPPSAQRRKSEATKPALGKQGMKDSSQYHDFLLLDSPSHPTGQEESGNKAPCRDHPSPLRATGLCCLASLVLKLKCVDHNRVETKLHSKH